MITSKQAPLFARAFKLKLTSGLRKVQFPRKSEPREAEVRGFSELKLNLGKICKISEPLNSC